MSQQKFSFSLELSIPTWQICSTFHKLFGSVDWKESMGLRLSAKKCRLGSERRLFVEPFGTHLHKKLSIAFQWISLQTPGAGLSCTPQWTLYSILGWSAISTSSLSNWILSCHFGCFRVACSWWKCWSAQCWNSWRNQQLYSREAHLQLWKYTRIRTFFSQC